jgi:hypothetical protein
MLRRSSRLRARSGFAADRVDGTDRSYGSSSGRQTQVAGYNHKRPHKGPTFSPAPWNPHPLFVPPIGARALLSCNSQSRRDSRTAF